MNIKKEITIGANTSNPITVKRFGYGTMRLTGEHVWGEPENRDEAVQILKATSENGIQFLDTADYYGEDVTNRLIAEALYPYRKDLVICTKVGADRGADKSWRAYDKPENLRASIENNLSTLKIDQIQLVHFRVMPGTDTPFEESLNAMFEMQKEGKILHVGLSNVNEYELNTALAMGSIATVENAFSYEQRTSFSVYGQEVRGMQEIMDICVKNNIPMIPFFSLLSSLPNNENKISLIAKKYNATPAQINLAWLLHFNDLILPIPGTSKLSHFQENNKALDIQLSEDDMAFLG
ncbi:aldo/keto reductase [Chryseobacterium sp. G0240]|uniref:aldo/keto reductase n=1 Tax=Chryseobacterium sp. G0240 TaxID=2487066 RepID=UPI000F44F50D|nr:aldo/keto reductase [Chryseobacterium sp. G0240]ROI03264.1 aldo/keto reductase [Chryseobacterium sp. G0240]